MKIAEMIALVLIFETFCCFPASAQEIHIGVPCELLKKNAADYEPGKDINGNAVAPADLKQEENKIQYPIEVPIEYDLIRLLDLPVQDEAKAEAEIVTVKVFEDGHIEYNGMDISDQADKFCIEDHEAPELINVPLKSEENAVNSGQHPEPAAGETEGKVSVPTLSDLAPSAKQEADGTESKE